MNAVLLTLAIVLLLVVLMQIGKVLELIGVIRGKEAVEESNNRMNAFFLTLTGIGCLIFCIGSVFIYQDKFLPVAASEVGRQIDAVQRLTLFFTGVVFIVTQVLLFAFAYRYQYRKNRKAYYFPENNTLELAWTVIPAVVLTVLVIRGLALWFNIFQPAPDDAVVIEANAQQFRWTIRYPGADNELGPRDLKFVNSTNELGIDWNDATSHDDIMPMDIVLPVNKPVQVNIRALDVLHNFYLPHFRMKMDAVPGIPTGFWFTPDITTAEMRERTGNPEFDYELACAELCGSAHYNMRKKVVIVTEAEYEQWLSEQTSYYEQVVLPQASK